MTTPNDAKVWTKAANDENKYHRGFYSSYFCTDNDHHDGGSDPQPAMLIANDGDYRGDGVCLRHAAKYLGKKT